MKKIILLLTVLTLINCSKDDNDGSIYQYINEFTIKHTEKCTLENCSKFQRNQIDRENIANTLLNVGEYEKCIIDLLDNIHCYFVHAKDIGHRINKNEINYDDNSIDIDDYLNKLSRSIKMKRDSVEIIRGNNNRIKNNKFMTTFNKKNTS